MADDDLVDDIALADPPASDAAQPVEPADEDVDLSLGDDLVDDGQEGEDDLDELEFGFKKYQVPKSLKKQVEDWRASTTQKEQSVAERAKALDTRESQIEERFKASDEEMDLRANLRVMTDTIDKYAALTAEDWEAHRLNDPIGTDQHWTRYQLLKDQKVALEAKAKEFEKARTDAAQQELAKRVTATTEFGQKNIPGFSQKQIDTLISFASEQGIDEETIKRNWSPTFYKLLHRAHLGDQLLARQAAARAAPKDTEPAVQPLRPTRSSGATMNKSPSQMSVADHAAAIRREKERARA